MSDAETQEILQSSISYSREDLLVVGWSGALVYGSTESAATTIQLLEYANTQLLELRHYDGLLTRLLDDVYRSLEHKTGVMAAWRLSREAARLNTLRLDVMELTEKVDNAIKFLSDMFYARLYGLAAAKVGVTDYRRLVDQKLRTAGGALPIHGGPVQSDAELRAGTFGGDNTDHRDNFPVSGQITLRAVAKPRLRGVLPIHGLYIWMFSQCNTS